ncbi:MAG TPA: hypothetical protein VK733_13390, partial [Gemmatimonadaceae bacterium]|nr:hypothetical protein [Gemmatimonadaceae bacterium]
YPLGDLLNDRPGTRPASQPAAVARNRLLLLDLARVWTGTAPMSSVAHWQLARALEAAGADSALDQMHVARRLAATPDERVHAGADEIRFLIGGNQFAAARALAETLATASVSIAESRQLAALDGLTGRVQEALVDTRRSTTTDTIDTPGGRVVVPPPVASAALDYLVYASFGSPADSVRVTAERAERAIDRWIDPVHRESVRHGLLDWPSTLAFSTIGARPEHPRTANGGNFLDLQSSLAHGDTGVVRRALTAMPVFGLTPSPAVAYEVALLRLAVGDSAGAAHSLDGVLDTPPFDPRVIEDVTEATCLVRAMALRAELATSPTDTARAARWSGAFRTLWAHPSFP